MIILYLYIAVTVGILLNAYLVKSKLIDEKMKSYSEGWEDGHRIGWGEGLREPLGDDPQADYRDEGVAYLRE